VVGIILFFILCYLHFYFFTVTTTTIIMFIFFILPTLPLPPFCVRNRCFEHLKKFKIPNLVLFCRKRNLFITDWPGMFGKVLLSKRKKLISHFNATIFLFIFILLVQNHLPLFYCFTIIIIVFFIPLKNITLFLWRSIPFCSCFQESKVSSNWSCQ